MSIFISFDCATITLGFMIAKCKKINKTAPKAMIIDCANLELELYKYGVVNLIPGKKVSEVKVKDRLIALRLFLDELTDGLNMEDIIIVVESQPGMNSQSNSIEDGIYMYFAYCKDIITIGSSKKNYISFSPSLVIGEFYAQAGNAKKKHTTANLVHYCNHYNISLDMSTSLYNHLADAFMQLVYYLFNECPEF